MNNIKSNHEKKLKKTAFLINSLSSGGAEKVVVTIINSLIKDNKKIELICIENNIFYEIPKNIKVTYLSKSRGKSNGILKFLQIPYLAYKLKKHIKKNNIEIVQSHLYRANYINIFSTIIGSKQQSQIVNHGIASRYKKKGIIGKINLLLIKFLYKKANKIILISEAMKLDLNKLFNFKNNQMIINNPYNILEINKLKNEYVNEFIFNPNKKYLITMGRLISLKRYKDVIETLKYINLNIELILLGEGNEENSLRELAKAYKIQDRVHFLGNVINPFKFLSKAHIFILSSETEGFPNSLIEALACKIQVISSDCISGPREIISPNSSVTKQLKDSIEVTKYGILYPVGNIPKLVESINIAIINTNNENIINGYNRALDFSTEKIMLNYKKVLEIE